MAFYSHYDEFLLLEPGAPEIDSSGRAFIPLNYNNKAQADMYGFETILTYTPFEWWQLQSSYSFLKVDMTLDEDSRDPFVVREQGQNPDHQATLIERAVYYG